MNDPNTLNPIYSSRLAKVLLAVVGALYFWGTIANVGVLLLSERSQNPQRLQRMMIHGIIDDGIIFTLCLVSYVLIVRRHKKAVAFTVLAMCSTVLIVLPVMISTLIHNGFHMYDLIEWLFVLPSCAFILIKTRPL